MKLNDKLFAHMRTATRTLLGQGPAAATAAIQQALNGKAAPPASAQPHPMRDINPPPRVNASASSAPPPPQPAPAHDAADVLSTLMPDLMANLDRVGQAGRAAFTMPSFEMPGFDVPGTRTPAEVLPGKFVDGSF